MKSVVISTLALLFLFTEQIQAKILVKVGAYEFPPYLEINNGQTSGLTIELITALNEMQSDYYFELVLTTPSRRFKDYQAGVFDAIFFEDLKWGWLQGHYAINHSPVFATDSEIFIALKLFAKSQMWFNNLKGKTMVGILGYHYQLANYQNNPEILEDKYKITLLNSHKKSIELVLKQRADTAIVTRSYLQMYLNENPTSKELILTSNRVAQTYNHHLLLRPTHHISLNTLYKWVTEALKQNALATKLRWLGIQPTDT